jgi:hypothetical protein
VSEAKDALERGDFALARKLAQENPTDSESKEVLERMAPDKVIVYLSAACVAFFVIVIALTIFHR